MDLERPSAGHEMGPGCADCIVAPGPSDVPARVLIVPNIVHNGFDAREQELEFPKIDPVPAGIRVDAHPVAPLGPALEDRLEVREGVWECGVGQPGHQVPVAAARRHLPARGGEPQAVPDPGPETAPHRHARRDQAEAGVDAQGAVSHVGLHEQHGRCPSSELRGKAPGPEFGALDHVRIEDREYPHQMVGMKQRHAVHQEEVLIARAAAHVQDGGEIGHPGHAGEDAHGPHRIGLRQPRQVPEFLSAQFLNRDARGFLEARPLPAAASLDDHGIQLDRLLRERDLKLEVRVRRQFDHLFVKGVADAPDGQAVAARHEVAEGEEAERVGAGHVLDGGVRRQPEAGGRAGHRDLDLGAHPAAEGRIQGQRCPCRPGHDDDLGAQFHVPQLRAVEQPVQGARNVLCCAGAVDDALRREEAGAEGDLNPGSLRELDQGFGQRHPVDGEAGGGGEQGSGLGVDSDLAPERGQLGVLGGGSCGAEDDGGDQHGRSRDR